MAALVGCKNHSMKNRKEKGGWKMENNENTA